MFSRGKMKEGRGKLTVNSVFLTQKQGVNQHVCEGRQK